MIRYDFWSRILIRCVEAAIIRYQCYLAVTSALFAEG